MLGAGELVERSFCNTLGKGELETNSSAKVTGMFSMGWILVSAKWILL